MEESEPKPLEADPQTPSQSTGRPLCTLLVFLVVMFAIHVAFCWWHTYNDRSWIRDPQTKTIWTIESLARRLAKYHEANGRFPEQLEALFAEQEDLDYVKKYELSDGWKRPLDYITDGQTWKLSSNGSDGQPGGVGVETDICFINTMFVKRGAYRVFEPSPQIIPPTLKQIFVKEFFHFVLYGFVTVLTYLAMTVGWLFILSLFVSKKQLIGCLFEKWGIILALVCLLFLNYMAAMIAMIPAARK